MSDDGAKPIEADRDQEMIREALQHTRNTRVAFARNSPPLPKDLLPGYTIIREIRRGGQGVVYEAKHHATHRRVAVKMLREGSLAGRVEQLRFQREMAVLGHFRHPNIVRLYDGGSVEGRPYYIMDYVEGQPFDRYVESITGQVREILILFQKIASAVHAAHLKGIVHRDLKPTNIRVDKNGEPHILDFGLAKLVEPADWSSQPEYSLTMDGQFAGSLPWAAPEQVESAGGEVDIRTDVYALGVILFHALTGRFPYQVVGSPRVVMDNILHVEPHRPSALERGLDEDVDTILLKCLSKDPSRRYQSAGELAQDLERYLDNQPIEARRDSTLYVVRRLIRRHQLVTAAGVAALVALVAFGVTVTILLEQASRARNDARRALTELQTTTSAVVGQLAPELTKIPKGSPARTKILTTALSAFQGLTDQGVDDPAVENGRANAMVQLSEMALVADQREEAMRLRLEIVAIREKLVLESPDDPVLLADLATDFVRVGDLFDGPGQLPDRRRLYERAFDIDTELVAKYPDNIRFLDDLAFGYERLGHLAKIAGDFDKADELFARQHELARILVQRAPGRPGSHWALRCSLGQLAAMREVRGDIAGSAKLQLEVRDAARRLQEMDPAKPEYSRAFVTSAAAVAALQIGEILPGSAIETLRESEISMTQLAQFDPDNHDRQRDLAGHYLGMADAYRAQADTPGAKRYAELARGVIQRLPSGPNDHPDMHKMILNASGLLAKHAQDEGDFDAQPTYEMEAIDAANHLETMYPDDPISLHGLAQFWISCGTPALCDHPRAESLARRSIKLSAVALPRPWLTLAWSLSAQQRIEEAHDAAQRALVLCPQDHAVLRGEIEALVRMLSKGSGGGRNKGNSNPRDDGLP